MDTARNKKGRNSSRIIATSLEIGRKHKQKPPKIFLLGERHKENGELVLRLPGGKSHINEKPQECAGREWREETPYRVRDFDTPLVKVYTHIEDGHDTDIFAAGFIETPKLPRGRTSPSGHWVELFFEVLARGLDYRGPYGLRVQVKHLIYLNRAFGPSSKLMGTLYSHMMVAAAIRTSPRKVRATAA